jgi:hypothetical protein
MLPPAEKRRGVGHLLRCSTMRDACGSSAPSPACGDLLRAFDGLAEAPGTFDWRGIELFWARNKA